MSFLIGLVAAVSLCGPADPIQRFQGFQAGAPPDILLILLDDVGIDQIGSYGAHPDPARTPVLDALADQGARFTRAYAEPVCSPTRAAVLTGMYAHRHELSGHITWPDPVPTNVPPLDLPTVPEQLPAVYRKEALGKWHLANMAVGMIHPLLVDFDTHAGTIGNPQSYTTWPLFVDGQSGFVLTTYLTIWIADQIIARSAEHDGPLFLWGGFHAPHLPFHKPPGALHTYSLPLAIQGNERIHYQAALEAADTEIGRLLATLDLSQTYVIIMGDNGTPKQAVAPPWDPEQQAKGQVYEGGIHVPLIIVGPGITPGVRTGLVHAVDIAPTIVELAGGPRDVFRDGQSLLPALFTDPSAGRRSVYVRYTNPNGAGPHTRHEDALIMGHWKLARDLLAGTERFHDLAQDPLELVDLLDVHRTPEQERALRRLRDTIVDP